jgi:hypothetical protein
VLIYIAGPMRGMPELNAPAFYRAAEQLHDAGHAVVNPHDLDKKYGYTSWENALKRDLTELVACDAIHLMTGWERSEGASLEAHVAAKLKIPRVDFYGYGLPFPTRETVLAEADRLIHGPRQQDYGHPTADFERTGRYWSILFGVEVPTWKVAAAMVMLKVSREENAHKRDNCVDAAGYVGCWAMCTEEDNAPGDGPPGTV